MKKILYLLLCIAFIGCTKSIEIDYENPIQKVNTENFLIGVWNGNFDCPNCGGVKKYGYILTINKQTKTTVEGLVKITNIPNPDTEYIEFYMTGSIENNKLTITTTSVKADIPIASNGINTYYWCKGNSYEFIISANKKQLNGTWTASSGCSYITRKGSTINLSKQ